MDSETAKRIARDYPVGRLPIDSPRGGEVLGLSIILDALARRDRREEVNAAIDVAVDAASKPHEFRGHVFEPASRTCWKCGMSYRDVQMMSGPQGSFDLTMCPRTFM